MTDHDPVNSPSHYVWHPSGIQQIEISEWCSFNIGAAIKYIWRHAHKGQPVQDLRKAAWHLRREMERLKNNAGAYFAGPENSNHSTLTEDIKSSFELPIQMAFSHLWSIRSGSPHMAMIFLKAAALLCEGHAGALEDRQATK